MPRRILICIEDTGVAHVVAARLMKDGADGVVVGSPASLVEEAQDGAVALVVQDRYPTGEAGASLLRQVRVAQGEAVPGVYLLTGDLADADRSVLEKQYQVQSFLPVAASPHQIAGSLLSAASEDGAEPDIVLHEDEADNDFEIDIASRADQLALSNLDEEGFSDDSDAMTVEVSLMDMRQAARAGDADSEIATELPNREKVQDEPTRHNPLMQKAVTKVGELSGSLDKDAPVTQEGLTGPDAQGATIESGPKPDALSDLSLPSDLSGDLAADLAGELDDDDESGGHLNAPGDLLGGDLEVAETGLMEFTMPAPGQSRDFELPEPGPGSAIEAPLEAPLDAPPLPSEEQPQESSQAEEDALLAALTPDEVTPPGQVAPAIVPTMVNLAPPEFTAGAQASPGDDSDSEVASPSAASASDAPASAVASDDEDEMQVQQLKKALLQKKRELEAAQKRIDDLENQVKSMPSAEGGVPAEGVPAEGVFEDIRYPALLSRARQEAFTGTIKMQLPGDITRTIYIRDGLPVAFKTSEQGDKIGKVLVSQGRVSDDQYVKAATHMVERGLNLSDALVDLGLIDKETLEVEIRNLTRDQIIAGFEQVQGRFTTAPDETPAESIKCFDFGPGEIYVQGYRQNAPGNEMQAHYESLRPKYLQANAKLASFRPKLGLTGDDERLIRLLGEAYTVEEAVERAKIAPTDSSRLIAALQALDLVEEWSPGVEQFRNRLTSERQYFIEEIASIREEAAKREKQLFEGFERALAKIGSSMTGPAPSMKSTMDAGPASDASGSSDPQKTSVVTVPEKSTPPAPSAPVTPPPAPPSGPTPKPAAASSVTVPEPKQPPPPPPEAAQPTLTPVGNGTPAPGNDKNLVLMDPALLGEPTSPADAKFHEAVRQAADNKLDEAEVTLREAVRMDAARPDFLVSLARVLLANPRYERAGTLPVVRSLLDRAVQLSPDNADAAKLHKEIVAEMGEAGA